MKLGAEAQRSRRQAPHQRSAEFPLGGLMATYNVSRHRKQKMAALVALEAWVG